MSSGITFTITRPGASSAEELDLSDVDFYSSSKVSRRKRACRAAPAPAPATRYRNAVYIVDGKYAQIHNYHLFSRIFGKPDLVVIDATATAQPPALRSKDMDFLLPSRYRGCSYCKRQNRAACTCKSNARKLLQGLPTCNICIAIAFDKGPDHCERELLGRRLGKFCTGCNTSHARMWFSPEQPKRKCGCMVLSLWAHVPGCDFRNTPLPRCITWERRVFMCAHSCFTWSEDLERFIFRIAKANWENRPFKNGLTFMDCPKCLSEYDEPHVLRPGVRYARDTNDDKHGRLELTWRLPLSAIKGNECDDMLCPHLTFSDGPCSIRKGLWDDARKGLIRCRSCGFRCFWTRKNRPGAETILRGRFVLWSSRTPKHLAPRRLWPLLSSPNHAEELLLRQSVVCRNEEFHFPERGPRTIQPQAGPFNPPPVQAQAQPFMGGSRNTFCLQVLVGGTTTQGRVSRRLPESRAARSA